MPINPLESLGDDKTLSELLKKFADIRKERQYYKDNTLSSLLYNSPFQGQSWKRDAPAYSYHVDYTIGTDNLCNPIKEVKKAPEKKRKELAGVLVYRKTDNDFEVLLTPDEDSQFWSIPKGEHLPDEENSAEAAIRELKKQTGVQVEVINVKYLCAADLPKNRKQVFAFFSNWNGDEPTEGASFVQLDVAYALMHPSQKIFIKNLEDILRYFR